MVLSLIENIEWSIRKQDKYGKTALHNTARAGNTAVAECLLSAIRKVLDLARSDTSEDLERYVNLRDTRGQTTLHYVVEKVPIGLFNSLFDSSANPNLTDNQRNTVLHSLCSSENPVDFSQKLERLLVSIIPIY